MNQYVDLGPDSYTIYIENGLLHHVDKIIAQVYKAGKIAIISDDNVFPLYGSLIMDKLSPFYEVTAIVIPHGEQSKRFDILPEIYSQLLDAHLTRTDLIIALGGGVIGDLAGFVASSYLRGIKFIQIPTSLLAQVDSSVGGKVAVDLPQGKNLVGAFKHPLQVIIDPDTLKTLPHRYLVDGMGEVIKYGCIKDRSLFEQLMTYNGYDELLKDMTLIIDNCVDIKRDVVEKDLYDFGDRLCLNFGHTIGHAVEQYYHYGTYSHGEAVAIGMVAITRLSEAKGITPEGTCDKLITLLKKYELPVSAGVKSEALLKAIANDKKNINAMMSYVMMTRIGETIIHRDDHQMILELEEI